MIISSVTDYDIIIVNDGIRYVYEVNYPEVSGYDVEKNFNKLYRKNKKKALEYFKANTKQKYRL